MKRNLQLLIMKGISFSLLLLFTFTSAFSQVEGTWKLAPTAQALAVGPTQGDFSWWSNSIGDVTTRACLFDDTFVFNADGTFSNVQGGETWLEGWQGAAAEGCGTPVAPHDGSNAATWAYDEAAGTITLTGVGAHLGLAKVNNAGELTDPANAPASITYPVVIEGNTMSVDIKFGETGFWHFAFEKVTETTPEPEPEPEPETVELAGIWKLAPTAQALAVGPTQGDFSWWSNSIGDVTTRACLFDDTFVFNADGTFSNVQGGETWLEGWQGAAAEGCGTPVAPHDGSNAATWAYDEAAGTVTLTGVGAHLGLAKVNNAGELTDPANAPASITYPVVIEGNTMSVDIKFGETGFWHFAFEKVTETTPEPEPETGVAGTWKLAPMAQALAVGPTQGDFSWWSNSTGDVTTRACLFDDTFVFNADGTFNNIQDGETWLEGWQGAAAEGCGAPVAPHDGSNAATWAYDEAAGTVTLTGVGAHLGLAKVNNAGELTSPADAPASITYPVVVDGNTMTVDIKFGETGFWHFAFQRVTGTEPEPEPEPTMSNVEFSVDMNEYDGAFTQVNLSGSLNGWSGDANPLADENGDGIWTGIVPLVAGDYEYKFTLDNWAVQEEFAEGASCTKTTDGFTNRIITVGADAAVCFKWNTCDACEEVEPEPVEPTTIAGTWKLAPIAQALAVGPTQGDFSWWSNSTDDVTTRACLFDDTFVFNADGTFSNVQDGETWLEGWQGADPEGCGTPVAPHDGSNAATWSFDEAAGTITLTGVGAHLGLAKVNNAGELADPANAPASITYPIVIEGNTMTVDIKFGETGFWHFVFEKQAETEPEPEPETGVAGTWKLAPMAQALAVGPTQGDFSWWSNSTDDVTTRACLFDDKFVFNADGTFSNVQDGDTWLEGWQGAAAEGCGTPVAPHDGSNAATWSFDEAAGTVTLTGVGAHLGLAKVNNAGELTDPANAPASITYPVVVDGNTMTVDIKFGETGFWHFVFEREATTSTSFEVAEEDLFSFFPNPASGQIQIKSDEVIDELTIHDITGKMLVMKNKPSSNETVDVSGLTSGLYIIQVRVGHKISVEKLSIK